MTKRDFEEFSNAESANPPKGLSEQILARVHMDLNPSAWKVFSKLSAIHFITALFTLSICPQFGFRLLGDGIGLMGYFMHFGEVGCTIACGSFFLGSSVLVAMTLLRPEDIRSVRSHKIFKLGALTLLSMGFFIMLQAEFILGFFLAWAIGSLLGGIFTLEVAWHIRLRLLKLTA